MTATPNRDRTRSPRWRAGTRRTRRAAVKPRLDRRRLWRRSAQWVYARYVGETPP